MESDAKTYFAFSASLRIFSEIPDLNKIDNSPYERTNIPIKGKHIMIEQKSLLIGKNYGTNESQMCLVNAMN